MRFLKFLLPLFILSNSAWAFNPYELAINQVNSAGTGYLSAPVTSTSQYIVGFGTGRVVTAFSPAQVVSNAGLTTLAAYGITDAYTKTASDALYVPIGGTFPWTGVTGAPAFITGNQTITCSGDATGSGTTAITLSVSKFNGQLPSYYLNYANLTGTPTLATVATTGAYSDLSGKPSLATVATTGAYSDLLGKPTLGTAAAQNASAFEVPLTFSTGLTRTTNTITVNTSQNISTLSNLTGNGFVKTSGGAGTLSIDTSTYLTTTGSGASLSALPSNTALYPALPYDASGAASAVLATSLQKASNLSDVANAATARTNLGLGSLATASTINNANWSGTVLSVANGGTGSASPAIVAGTGISVTGTWPNQTISSSAAIPQRTRLQTNTTGVLTWTYPIAYGTGVIPIITATAENSSTTNSFNVQIVSVNNTSVTLQAFGVNPSFISLLGLSLLQFLSTPQCYIHLTAVSP